MISDIAWEKLAPDIFETFSDVQFYDYTKDPRRVGLIRPNYWVTFSRSETNESKCLDILRAAHNVAVVFDVGALSSAVSRGFTPLSIPKTWNGFPVINGDESDLRFLDTRGRKRGRVVGMTLKATDNELRTNAIASGFAIGGRA